MVSREKQAAVLNRVQRERKQEYQQKVIQAVAQLRQQGQPISFKNIQSISGISTSYLYKWDHIKDYIRSEQKKDKTSSIESQDKNQPYSYRTQHEVTLVSLKELQIEIKELKRQNTLLQGHVTEIHELREECERLRQRIKELTYPSQMAGDSNDKVTPLKQEPLNSQTSDYQISSKITDALNKTGIKLNITIKREIQRHSVEAVIDAIEAFIEYRHENVIQKPSACLLKMIRDEAKPNSLDQSSESSQNSPTQLTIGKPPSRVSKQDSVQKRTSNSNLDKQKSESSLLVEEQLLEAENETLRKQNQHLMKLLIQAQSDERKKSAADFSKARIESKNLLDKIPDVDF